MNILQLRDTVSQLLSELIGTYTLPNNTQQPALYVVGEHGVPKGWKASGLEVTIRQYPRQTSRPLVGTVQINKMWEVMLVNYTPSSKSLEEAILRILRHFPDARSNYQEYSDIAYEQYRVLIPDVEAVTQYMPAV
jgi:hypothetical protein